MADTDGVTITLTSDESLVLFDLLHRWEDDQLMPVDNQAERTALWNLLASLERVMVEPFSPDYAQLLSEARMRLTPSG